MGKQLQGRKERAEALDNLDSGFAIIGPMATFAQSSTAGLEPAGLELAESKLHSLEDRLRALGSVMVAYSGGVDSAFLAATAHRVLGDRMLAVLADSPSLARRRLTKPSRSTSPPRPASAGRCSPVCLAGGTVRS